MLANFSQRIAFYAVLGYLAAYLIDSYDVSVGETALPLAVVGAGAVIGSLFGGMIASHQKRLGLVAASGLAGGAGVLIVFAIDPAIWATVAIAFGAVCVLSIGWPVFITFATDIAGPSRATAIGMMGASNRMGGFIGSVLPGDGGGLSAGDEVGGSRTSCVGLDEPDPFFGRRGHGVLRDSGNRIDVGAIVGRHRRRF